MQMAAAVGGIGGSADARRQAGVVFPSRVGLGPDSVTLVSVIGSCPPLCYRFCIRQLPDLYATMEK